MLGQKIELLGALPIFRGLSTKQLSRIVDVSVKWYFEAGEDLIFRGRSGNAAFLIVSGIAQCLDFPGNPKAGEHIGAGSLVGELAMLAETAYSVTVRARTRVRALSLQREALRWVMERDPSIAQKISDNLLLRLRSFASDLSRLDDFLEKIELSAPTIYSVRGILEAPASSVSQPAALAQ
jgi:CRP-like cAMP-binding protein